jgi:D-sedoheptulose 7-phosphate isomerase
MKDNEIIMEQIRKEFIEAQIVLNDFINTPGNLESIEQAGKMMVNSLKSGRKIISCGNGGSMSDAMHFAEELTGRYRDDRPSIAAVSISDATHLTCVANDYGFESIFSRYVESIGNKGDVLLAISTSGNSANILKAAEAAKQKGLKVVGLTGKSGGKLAHLCDVEIRVEHFGYADRIQEIHIKVIHTLINYIEMNMFRQL